MRVAWRCTKSLSPAVGRKGLFLLKLRDPAIILAAALCHGPSPVVKRRCWSRANVVSGNAPLCAEERPIILQSRRCTDTDTEERINFLRDGLVREAGGTSLLGNEPLDRRHLVNVELLLRSCEHLVGDVWLTPIAYMVP